jgi:hypothetical protein
MDCVFGQRSADGSLHIVLDNVPPFHGVFNIEWQTRRGIAIRMTPRGADELYSHLGALLADVSVEQTCRPSE